MPEKTNAMMHKTEKRPMIHENKLVKIFDTEASESPVCPLVGKQMPPTDSKPASEHEALIEVVFVPEYADLGVPETDPAAEDSEPEELELEDPALEAPPEVSTHVPPMLHWPVFPPPKEQVWKAVAPVPSQVTEPVLPVFDAPDVEPVPDEALLARR